MRTFNFKVKNISDEKYLTYLLDADCELDEDTLDYCQDNEVKELLDIIYEEDDDENDYLTYNITDKISLDSYIKDYVKCNDVLAIIRNVSNGLISLKEQTIHLSYVLMNRSFIYVDKSNLEVSFICLPVESEGSVITEFKGFVRQLLANMKYDVEEDLNYVGKLITYINGDKFNLRDLIGLCEALMEEAGISYEEEDTISADGVEVVTSAHEDNVTSFMDSLGVSNEPLPEIGDDEEELDEEDSEDSEDSEAEGIVFVDDEPTSNEEAADEIEANDVEEKAETEQKSDEPTVADYTEEKEENATSKTEPEQPDISEIPEAVEIPDEQKKSKLSIIPNNDEMLGINEYDSVGNSGVLVNAEEAKRNRKESDVNVIKNRIRELVGDTSGSSDDVKTIPEVTPTYFERNVTPKKKNVVKVNRAAIIQNVEAEIEKETVVDDLGEENPTENIALSVVEDVKNDGADKKAQEATPIPQSAMVNSVSNVPKAAPYLVRVNTEERVMILKVPFKLGKATRGIDYTIRGNSAISRQHAIIVEKDGVCYIRDNKSTNHTYVNGKMVEDGVDEMLTHDAMITLGDEDFLFKIR